MCSDASGSSCQSILVPVHKHIVPRPGVGELFVSGTSEGYEISANITTLQWHLALIAFLVLLAPPAASHRWPAFDAILLMLTSLDGPMGILLVPIAAVLSLNKPENRSKKIPIVLLCCSALVQTVTILWSHSRTVHSNDATLVRLISILGRQIFLGSLLGMNLVYQLIRMHAAYAIEVAAVLLGLPILLYGFWHARLEIRLMLTFARGVRGVVASSIG